MLFLFNVNKKTPKNDPNTATILNLVSSSFKMKYAAIAMRIGLKLKIKVALLAGIYLRPIKNHGIPIPPKIHLKSNFSLYPYFMSKTLTLVEITWPSDIRVIVGALRST